MLMISLLRAVFLTVALYLVFGLSTSIWNNWFLALEVFLIAWIGNFTYEVVLDKMINWFNSDDVFRG